MGCEAGPGLLIMKRAVVFEPMFLTLYSGGKVKLPLLAWRRIGSL